MKYLLIVGFAGVYLSGCATMIRGTEQPLQMTSEPPGAKASLGSGQTCTTPCSITLSRSTSTVVSFEKEGCERQMVSVFPTLAGAGVILGGVIDYGTGAVYNLQPNPVVAQLRCGRETAGGPTAAIIPAVATLPSTNAAPSLEAQLVDIKNLLDKELITQAEYDQKRQELLRGW